MFSVTGKSIKDILNIKSKTFNSLELSEMRKVVGRLVSAGNKRLRSFEKSGEKSPAVRYVEKTGGKFSTRNKNLNELRSEYIRAKNFLQSKTGSRSGWKEVKKETLLGLGNNGIKVSDKEFDKFWNAYEALKELSPDISNRQLKYTAMKEVANMVVDGNKSAEDIALDLYDKLNEIYEENETIDYDYNGVSQFFDIE